MRKSLPRTDGIFKDTRGLGRPKTGTEHTLGPNVANVGGSTEWLSSVLRRLPDFRIISLAFNVASKEFE